MLDWTILPAFIVSALVIILSPGADTFLLLRATIRGGTKDGFATFFGIITGIALLSVLLISGVGLVIAKVPQALFGLKIAGSLYLLYLAVRSFLAGIKLVKQLRSTDSDVSEEPLPSRVKAGPYVVGFLTNVTNPKVLIFFLAFFPQFLGRAENSLWQLVMLCAVFLIASIPWLLMLIFTASAMRKILTTVGFTIAMEFVVGVVFTVLSITLLVTGLAVPH